METSQFGIADIFDGAYTQAAGSPSSKMPKASLKTRTLLFHLCIDDSYIPEYEKNTKITQAVLVCLNFPQADRKKGAFAPFAFPQQTIEDAHTDFLSFFHCLTNDFSQAQHGQIIFNSSLNEYELVFSKLVSMSGDQSAVNGIIGYTGMDSAYPCATCNVTQYFSGMPSGSNFETVTPELCGSQKSQMQGIPTTLSTQDLSIRTSEAALDVTRSIPVYTDFPVAVPYPRPASFAAEEIGENTGVIDRTSFFIEDPKHFLQTFRGPESLLPDLTSFIFVHLVPFMLNFLVPIHTWMQTPRC